jgi:DNA-binding LacI/PurR family transcriptional regulator
MQTPSVPAIPLLALTKPPQGRKTQEKSGIQDSSSGTGGARAFCDIIIDMAPNASERLNDWRGRPTIHEVAVKADVSITTVSHVLSGKGRVAKQTKDRVLWAVEQTGYRANTHAQQLATRRSRTIAIQISSSTTQSNHTIVPASEYFLQVLNGASAKAAELDFALILTPPGPLQMADVRFSVDGIIVVDPRGDEPFFTDSRFSKIPLVTTGRRTKSDSQNFVIDNDHRKSATILLDHLHRQSYLRPALVTASTEWSYCYDLVEGYASWAEEHHLRPTVVELTAPPTRQSAALALRQLIDSDSPPDAILASSEELAADLLQEALRHGVDVPRQIGICSAVDSGILELLSPQVTAMHLNPLAIGRRSVELLVQILDEEVIDPLTIGIPTQLRERSSTSRS